MVTFIPPYMGEEIKSNAEKKMYEVLQQLDMKNAYVLHSLGLPKHQSKIYGEIDFVVVSERGVACLEIKGGRVECRDGRWFFTDRYGIEREKPEGPFAQVTGNMFSLRDILKNRFSNDLHLKNVLVACGVVFPDIEFKSTSMECIPEIVYDKKTTDISTYMKGVFDYWQERQHREPAKLSPSDIRNVVDLLRGDYCYIPSLGDRLENVEKHLVRLTNEQAMIMEALSSNKHLLVEGGAGTGKTLLAVDYARKQAEKGKKVLFLTFNKNLAYNVKCQMPENENLKIINIHALFGEYVAVDTQEMQKNPQQYFSDVLPEKCYDYFCNLSKKELESLQYDILVMDEGQDILKPAYLYLLDYLLRGGLEQGIWAFFYDEKQNIYNPEYRDGMEILHSYPSTNFKLFINCRNTVQIGTCGSRISGIELGEFIRENGEEVQKVSYVDEADFGKKIKEILKHLRKEKVAMKDVVFLSPKKYKNSMLSQVNVEVNELGDDFEDDSDAPDYSTIQGFKGLDSKVVVLFDVDTIKPENFSKYIYIAVTRARTLLYIVSTEAFWQEHGM